VHRRASRPGEPPVPVSSRPGEPPVPVSLQYWFEATAPVEPGCKGGGPGRRPDAKRAGSMQPALLLPTLTSMVPQLGLAVVAPRSINARCHSPASRLCPYELRVAGAEGAALSRHEVARTRKFPASGCNARVREAW
jgi:hypothetical protein